MKSLKLLNALRLEGIQNDMILGNRKLIGVLKNIPIKQLLNEVGKNSLGYFRLRQRRINLVGDMTRDDFREIDRFLLNMSFRNPIQVILQVRDWLRPGPEDLLTIPYRGKLQLLHKLGAKEFRTLINDNDQICLFKSGVIMSPSCSNNYFKKISKLTSVAHRNSILRALHGDIYTNSRLFLFGLRQDPICSRCNGHDTIEHRLNECPRVIELIEALTARTNRLGDSNMRSTPEPRDKLLAIHNDIDLATLTTHAEIIRLVNGTSELRDPENIIVRTLRILIAKEGNYDVKNQLKSLLRGD
jgi:hypothetical protein